VDVRFHVMSLAVLNEGRPGLTESYRARMREAWEPVRVVTATALSYGDRAVRDLYSALGPLIHHERRPIGRDLLALALSSADLPHTLANAAKTTVYDEALRASHRAGTAPLGDAAATPIIHLNGDAFVGPVLTPIPRGEAAGRLWDAVALAAGTDGFFVLRRPRTRRPAFD
jgi:hypothetical protein